MTTPTPETPTSDPFPWEQVDPEIAAAYDVPPDQLHTIDRDALPLVTRATPDDDEDGPPIEAIIGPDYSADDVVDAEIVCEDPCEGHTGPHPYDAATCLPPLRSDDVVDAIRAVEVELSDAVIDSRTAYVLLDGLAADAVRRDTATRVRETLVDVVRLRAGERRKARTDKVKSSTDVRLEAVGLGDDAESLDALAGAFTAAAGEARELAGDLIDDVPRARVSFKVADGRGFELKVCRDQRRELSVDLDAVVDVLVASLLVGSDELALSGNGVIAARAAGIREGIAALRDVLSTSPTFRSTALDSLATRLENVDEDDLAKRLRAAYGRVDVGDPRVKLERKPLEEKGGRS